MKVLIISDLTFENLLRRQLRDSKHQFSVVYSEDLVSAISLFTNFESYDLILIYFDSFFKKYDDDYIALILSEITIMTSKTTKYILSSNIFTRGWTQIPLNESFGLQYDFPETIQTLINKLIKINNFIFIDVAELITSLGRKQVYNYETGHLYQMPYSKAFLDEYASLIEQTIDKFAFPDKKVIVLDCDNTLWGGIIGEDGVKGISCDLNHNGILYYHFQQFLKAKKSIGFILCLCSKNNELDAYTAFYEKNMPLKWDDFVIKKINWDEKERNIQEIANELNVGLDSLIFIDDSDFELNRINESLPEVSLIKMTNSYEAFVRLTKNVIFFKKTITDEDKSKTEQYKDEINRKEIELNSSSFEDYVKNLEIKISIDFNNKSDLQRISQLTEKTNQFNFNKVVYSVEELSSMLQNDSIAFFSLRVSDKFGEYGLTGVILLCFEGEDIIVENYILSCRVLGRRIEFDFYFETLKRIEFIYGKKISKIKFIETSKNIPAKTFYQQIKETT